MASCRPENEHTDKAKEEKIRTLIYVTQVFGLPPIDPGLMRLTNI